VIEVRDYDPAWPDRFAALRREYATALDAAGVPYAGIEHVGSTSVPGLAAKPVIDCDIVVAAAHVGAAAADIYAYGAGKNDTVQRILAAAGLTDGERASIGANQVPIRRPTEP
jgi:GrpB-like predicted nucleotidyltransferase (UPF0157 family)